MPFVGKRRKRRTACMRFRSPMCVVSIKCLPFRAHFCFALNNNNKKKRRINKYCRLNPIRSPRYFLSSHLAIVSSFIESSRRPFLISCPQGLLWAGAVQIQKATQKFWLAIPQSAQWHSTVEVYASLNALTLPLPSSNNSNNFSIPFRFVLINQA